MAEFSTPSAATMATADTSIDKKKPEKPDEELFNANVKQAEKEHAESMAKLVCIFISLSVSCIYTGSSLMLIC